MIIPSQVGGTTPLWCCEIDPKLVEPSGDKSYPLTLVVIGEPLEGPGVYLFECDASWRTVFDTWYETFDKALAAAIAAYPSAGDQGNHLSRHHRHPSW